MDLRTDLCSALIPRVVGEMSIPAGYSKSFSTERSKHHHHRLCPKNTKSKNSFISPDDGSFSAFCPIAGRLTGGCHNTEGNRIEILKRPLFRLAMTFSSCLSCVRPRIRHPHPNPMLISAHVILSNETLRTGFLGVNFIGRMSLVHAMFSAQAAI